MLCSLQVYVGPNNRKIVDRPEKCCDMVLPLHVPCKKDECRTPAVVIWGNEEDKLIRPVEF